MHWSDTWGEKKEFQNSQNLVTVNTTIHTLFYTITGRFLKINPSDHRLHDKKRKYHLLCRVFNIYLRLFSKKSIKYYLVCIYYCVLFLSTIVLNGFRCSLCISNIIKSCFTSVYFTNTKAYILQKKIK